MPVGSTKRHSFDSSHAGTRRKDVLPKAKVYTPATTGSFLSYYSLAVGYTTLPLWVLVMVRTNLGWKIELHSEAVSLLQVSSPYDTEQQKSSLIRIKYAIR